MRSVMQLNDDGSDIMKTVRGSRSIDGSGHLLVAAALALSSSACSVTAIMTPVHLDAYHGDGTITKVCDWRTPGAQVEFDAFSLQTPYHRVYSLAGLPARPIAYTIELHVVDVPEFRWVPGGSKIGAEGTLKFELRDISGHVLFSCVGSPEDRGWGRLGSTALGTPCQMSSPRAGQAVILPENFADPENPPAELEVEWSPGSNAPDLKAHVLMKSGATC